MDGGIEVVESNRFEQLVRTLTDRVASGSETGVLSFAEPVDLIVPTLDHGDYARLALARQRGAISNLQVSRLQAYLSGLLFDGRDGEELLTRSILTPLVLDELDGVEQSGISDFAPLRDYLEVDAEAGEDEPDPIERRRYMLARRVSGYLEEYTFSRPELIEAWNADEVWPYETAEPRHVRWQCRLWQSLTNENGAVEADETSYYTLEGGLERRLDEMGDAVTVERPLHLFGFANVGEVFLDVLEEVADHRPVYLYRLDPAPREGADGDAWFDRVGTDRPAEQIHPALDRWGRVGAEAARMQRQRADGVERVFGEPEGGDSWLSWTQSRIALPPGRDELEEAEMAFDGPAGATQWHDKFDGSLRALACPNVRREIEVVANDIWRRVGEGDVGAFSDVAIAVPPADEKRYYPQIRAVFETFEQLPYTLNSAPLFSESRVFEAFELLLDLPYGNFRRDEFLPFLTHPNVAGRYAEADPKQWAAWVESLGIYHGADHGDHENTYIERDLFNWEQGLRRLVLGHYLTSPDVSANDVIEIEGDDGKRRYLPESLDSARDSDATAFDELTSALIADVRWLRRHEAPLEEWADIFQSLVDTYLHPARSEEADWETDRREMERLKTAFDTLAEGPGAERAWNYDQASLFARDALEKLTRTTPHAFTDGVVVAPPSELRGLPFDHVYMVGMGAGRYPARASEKTLDLRRARRQPGDVLPDERDQYHFLELLLSARDGFHVSWVARDPTTGEEIAPSSVVSDLKRFLDVETEPEELFGDDMTIVFPLRRFDRHGEAFRGLDEEHNLPEDDRPSNDDVTDARGRQYHPAAFREAQMDAVREVLDGHAGESEPEELFDQIEALDGAGHRLRVREVQQDESDDREVRRKRVRYSVLVRYLKTPLQTEAKRRYGLWEEGDDPRSEPREPFELDRPASTVVPRDVIQTALAEPLSEARLDALYRARIEPDLLGGKWPIGSFGDAVRASVGERLAAWEENYTRHYPPSGEGHIQSTADEKVCFVEVGEAANRRGVDAEHVESVGPLEFTVADPESSEELEFELYGTTRPLTPELDAIVEPVKKNKKFRNSLRPYIDHLVLSAAAAEWAERERECVLLREGSTTDGPGDSTATPYRFPAIEQEEARAYLRALLETLFVDDRHYLFPVDAAKECRSGAIHREALRAELEDDSKHGGIYSQYGPLMDYLSYPVPDNPVAFARERFRYHPALHDLGEDRT